MNKESHHKSLTEEEQKEIAKFFNEEDEENQEAIDIRSRSIESELSERYTPDMVKLFKRLSYELSVIGLPLEDACLIVGLEYDKMTDLIAKDETVARLIKLKDLQYKRGLLSVVSKHAKGDEKTSLWMLERRYPEEFNVKKGQGGGKGDGDDHLRTAITFIQMGGDNTPLVAKKNGREYLVDRTDNEHKGVMSRIKDILS